MTINLDGFRPMKSASPPQDFDWGTINYPILASRKYDGIRCVIHPYLGVVSNTLKRIPNEFIQHCLHRGPLNYLDGELLVVPINSPDQAQRSQSAVMSEGDDPDFRYLVFDNFEAGTTCNYGIRVEDYTRVVTAYGSDYIIPVEQVRCENVVELLDFEEKCLQEGYEGVIVRSITGKYKFGRSTLKQGDMIKMKRYIDAEGEVIGWAPLELNRNDPIIDQLGLQKRMYMKAGKIIDDSRVGSLTLRVINGRFKGTTTSIGSGFDDSLRMRMREAIRRADEAGDRRDGTTLDAVEASADYPIGKIVTFKYQDHGSKDTVRQPIFKTFRDHRDITT